MGKNTTEINGFLNKIIKNFSPKFIVLFGSRARKDFLKGSDYDILIVSDEFKKLSIFERISNVIQYWKMKKDLEVVCFTSNEFEEKLRTMNAIVYESLKDGICLYGERNFNKYRNIFKNAVNKKEIFVANNISFKVMPEKIFPEVIS